MFYFLEVMTALDYERIPESAPNRCVVTGQREPVY